MGSSGRLVNIPYCVVLLTFVKIVIKLGAYILTLYYKGGFIPMAAAALKVEAS
jgi:hypothetical protein